MKNKLQREEEWKKGSQTTEVKSGCGTFSLDTESGRTQGTEITIKWQTHNQGEYQLDF